MPKVDKKPKNNKDNKFRWVDMQWEKFMNRHDEDMKIIDQLREDLITCNKFFQERREQLLELEQENTKLRIALCNLRDEFLDLGGDVNQLELFDKNNPFRWVDSQWEMFMTEQKEHKAMIKQLQEDLGTCTKNYSRLYDKYRKLEEKSKNG